MLCVRLTLFLVPSGFNICRFWYFWLYQVQVPRHCRSLLWGVAGHRSLQPAPVAPPQGMTGPCSQGGGTLGKTWVRKGEKNAIQAVPESLQSLMEQWNRERGKGGAESVLNTCFSHSLHYHYRGGSKGVWSAGLHVVQGKGGGMWSLCFLLPESISNSLYVDRKMSGPIFLPCLSGEQVWVRSWVGIWKLGTLDLRIDIQKWRSEYATSI